MSERAPDEMPTQVLRNMVEHADTKTIDWVRVIENLEWRLGAARKSAAYWHEQYTKLSAQLAVREKEEASG